MDDDDEGFDREVTLAVEHYQLTDEQKLMRQKRITDMAKNTRRLLSERRQLGLLRKTVTSIHNKKKMNEIDGNGWGHIHHASFRGYVKSVGRFIENVPEQLEMETSDGLQSTPLLLACMGGNLDTVKLLVEAGAKITKLNLQRHGVVELSAFRVYVDILHYLTELGDDIIQAWKLLVKFAMSDFDEEAEASAKSIRLMISESLEPRHTKHLQSAYKNGIVPALLKMIKGSMGDEAKCEMFRLVLVLIRCTFKQPEQEDGSNQQSQDKDDTISGDQPTIIDHHSLHKQIRDDVISAGLIPAMVRNLKSSNSNLLQLVCQTATELCKDALYAEQLIHNGAVPAIVRVLQTLNEGEALPPIAESLGAIAAVSQSQQVAVATTPGALTALVEVLRKQTYYGALEAVCYAVARIVRGNEANQNAWAAEGALTDLLSQSRSKSSDVQTAALEAITCVAQNNPNIQEAIIGTDGILNRTDSYVYDVCKTIRVGAIETLMDVLTKIRHGALKEHTAMALWSLAGDNVDRKKFIAERMGISLLVEFVNSPSENLNFIGSEAVCALVRGPRCKESLEITSSVVAPLVRLLRSKREVIVLSGLRTIRQLCVSIGYVPNIAHQDVIVHALGVSLLVALMVHSNNEFIQAEAAHTLSCLVLGNPKCLEEVKKNVEFSFVRVVKMLYSNNPEVRILAGSALAAFAFNNHHNQEAIVEDGGVRFHSFLPFIRSDNELFRCYAAFQIIVLSPIIPDENSATCCAAGLKLLSDLLVTSQNDSMLMLTCDCFARLSHLGSGIPHAIGAIGVIDQLVSLLSSQSEPVRGAAAIALGFLSYNFECRRQLIQKCRADAVLMPILRKYMYNDLLALCPDFVEAWTHYARLTFLPKIKSPPKKKFRFYHVKKGSEPNGTFLPPVNQRNGAVDDKNNKSRSIGAYNVDPSRSSADALMTGSLNIKLVDLSSVDSNQHTIPIKSNMPPREVTPNARSRYSFASESIAGAMEEA